MAARLIIELTAPDGTPVWIDSASIEKFMPSRDHPGGTLLWSYAGTQEVQEMPDKILQMLAMAAHKFRVMHVKMQRGKTKDCPTQSSSRSK